MTKKITAIVLSIALVFSAFAIPASAATEVTSDFERGFYRVVDKILDALVTGIASLIVEPSDWITKDEYKTENFYKGNDVNEFIDEPAEGAKWSLGYANASILTGKELEDEHYVGGSLAIGKKLATEQKDDQMVRTIAISDGRGVSFFAVIDSFGLANNEVRAIRKQFEAYAAEKNIEVTSINISTLHQHSCVDTFGMNGDLLGALFTSSFRNLFRMDLPSGKNESYMNNLRKVTVQSMINAYDDMKDGSLYYGTVDMTEYIRDKRDPQVFDGNMNRLRFVPDAEGAKETWLINIPVHCVGNGAAGTALTGDYPLFMEKYINENANANFIQILGAELAVSSQYPENLERDPAIEAQHGDRYAGLVAYGELLGKLACTINNDVAVSPILNIRYTEVFVPVDNSIFKLAARGGLLTNTVVKDGLDYLAVTEVGYAEFGSNIAVAIIPGELAPEIAFGGAITAEESWDGKDWNYTAFADATNRKLLVFGLTNDQIGYMMTDNDWRSYLTENEEIVSAGPKAGAKIAEAYLTLFNEVN